MSRGTAGKALAVVASNGYSYRFDFGQEGTWNDPPVCDFCGKEYEGLGVQVNLDCGLEICPDCLIAGPKAVAEKVRALRREEVCGEEILETVKVIGRLDSFTQLPRGILAMKIAEGYMVYREGRKEV